MSTQQHRDNRSTHDTDVRPSPLAGRWYPGRADELVAMMDRFLEAAQPVPIQGVVRGLLAPHAGYRYSGPVAAHAFAQVRGLSVDTVVVIGPMHHLYADAVLTTDHSAYVTPLGQISVDQEGIDALTAYVPIARVRNDPEHSVEIELPFLQHTLMPGFNLIPIMLRDQSLSQATALGEALADVLRDRRVLLVASSDLSHFYPQDVANQFDTMMLACIEAMDKQCVVEYNEGRTAFACGYGAIATMLDTLERWQVKRGSMVGYATSGDVTGDLQEVVGYGAIMFYEAA